MNAPVHDRTTVARQARRGTERDLPSERARPACRPGGSTICASTSTPTCSTGGWCGCTASSAPGSPTCRASASSELAARTEGAEGDPVPSLAVARALLHRARSCSWSIFTNVRARGVYSFVLLLLCRRLVWGVQKIPGIETAFGWARPAARAPQPRLLSDVLGAADADLALRHRLRRPLHVVAVLAGPGDRGAPRSGRRRGMPTTRRA